VEPLGKPIEVFERQLQLGLGPVDSLRGGATAGGYARAAQLLGQLFQPVLRAFAQPRLQALPLCIADLEDPPARCPKLGHLGAGLGLKTRIRRCEPSRR
jgi:hypothetical protein